MRPCHAAPVEPHWEWCVNVLLQLLGQSAAHTIHASIVNHAMVGLWVMTSTVGSYAMPVTESVAPSSSLAGLAVTYTGCTHQTVVLDQPETVWHVARVGGGCSVPGSFPGQCQFRIGLHALGQ